MDLVKSLKYNFNKALWIVQRRVFDMPRLYGVSLSERIVEYSWVLNNIEGRKILDVGCHGTFFPLTLANLDYKVTGIDLKEWKLPHPYYRFEKCDARSLPFEKNDFDTIICISTLEHINVSNDLDEELKVMDNFKRILNEKGIVLMTFGYGSKLKVEDEVTYDEESVKKISDGFDVEKRDIFYKNEKGWTKVNNPKNGEYKDIICLKMRV